MNLSVITITLNAEKVVEKTILSVLNQTIPIYEYILVDGLSCDDTNSIIEMYRKVFEDKGIRFVHIVEKDNGISDAFNKGIRCCTGDFVSIINADDELCLNTNEILNKQFDLIDSYDVIYGNCCWIDEVENLEVIKKPTHNYSKLFYELIFYHPATFIRKSCYDSLGGYNVNYKLCMDKEFFCRVLMARRKFWYVDATLAKVTAGGVSDANPIKTIKEGITIAKSFNKPILVIYTNAIKKILLHYGSKVAIKLGVYKYIKRK